MDEPWREPGVQRLSEAIATSFRGLLGRELVSLPTAQHGPVVLAESLYVAPCAVLCHDAVEDPKFTYANRAAQEVFARSWDDFIGLPSRLSAEPDNRQRRAQMLAEVARAGFVDGYSGIRVTATGLRFAIEEAVVWNVTGADGTDFGQAAMICRWRFLPDIPS